MTAAVHAQHAHCQMPLLLRHCSRSLRAPPCCITACLGPQALAEMLDSGRIRVDAVDNAGVTPLIRAAYAGMQPACKLLLERGADANAVSVEGMTALAVASLQGHSGIQNMLLVPT